MFDLFAVIKSGFSGLTGSKGTTNGIANNTQIGQTVPSTPGMVTNAGGNGAAYGATDTPSISLLTGVGKNGANLSSGGAAATHYGKVLDQESKFNSSDAKAWLEKAQAVYDQNKSQNQQIQESPTTPGTKPHYQQLGNMGATEATKAPALSLAAAIGKPQKQITSTDFKNQAGV